MTTKPALIAFFALTLALLPAAGLLADMGTWTGWVTDEHCGAKGANAGHKDCAVKCHKDGAKLVFYNTADEKIYQLDNQELAAQHLGHEVKVSGEVEGDAIKVKSIDKAAM